MIRVRKAGERGVTDFGWLNSRHTFSFGRHHDPAHMGFGPLRVINDDRVAPGGGFDTHGHSDMEIVSYVLEGALEHRDSLGTGSIIRPGDVQRMSAGKGIRHSEFNHSRTDPVRFLQIWILPERDGLEPGYEQIAVAEDDKRGRLALVGSRDGRGGSVTIHGDVDIYAGRFERGDSAKLDVRSGRAVWGQIARGEVTIAGVDLAEGDGIAVRDVPAISIERGRGAEILIFDMAA